MNPIQLVLDSYDLLRALTQTGGELTPEIDGMIARFASQLDLCAELDEQLDAEGKYFRARAAFYSKMAKGRETALERLRTNLSDSMKAGGKSELQGDSGYWKLVTQGQKVVTDEAKLEPAYLICVQEWKADKERVKAALEAGEKIMGASLQPITSLRWYPKKIKP